MRIVITYFKQIIQNYIEYIFIYNDKKYLSEGTQMSQEMSQEIKSEYEKIKDKISYDDFLKKWKKESMIMKM